MASAEELDELFAYLDQLALNERLEQEKGVVTGVGLQGPGEADQGTAGSTVLHEGAVVEPNGSQPYSRVTPVSDELETTSFLSVEGEFEL
jgi:hypothetical protein